jgi:hypothetical protein
MPFAIILRQVIFEQRLTHWFRGATPSLLNRNNNSGEEMKMKKKVLSVGFALVLLLFVVSVSFADVALNGVYEEEGYPDSVAVYAQDGNMIYVTGYYVINGQPRVWYGRGQRAGDTISYTTKITRGPSSLTTMRPGKHTLTISPDGTTMTGKATSGDGTSSSFTMKKKAN